MKRLRKKRKRAISNVVKPIAGDVFAPQATKPYIDTDSLFPSTPPNKEEEELSSSSGINHAEKLSSISPRTAAIRQFAYLSIRGKTEGTESPRLKPQDDQELSIPPIDLRLDAITTLRDETSTPPAKRLPPPRGIKSPRPKHRSSPFILPSTPSSSLLSSVTSSDGTPQLSFDFDFRALSWQDSEITGHLMLDSDDDGTGINGIGFRPTAATALARSQRRRRQVLEWKTRQAREERERRAERRKGLEMELGGVDGGVGKKVVRFAV